MIRFIAATALLFVMACKGDETVAKYGARGKIWQLVELDNQTYQARAQIEFGKDGQVTGHAPCNRFSTTQTAPYPWFKLGPLAATKMACRDLVSETAFFKALAEMSLSEVSATTLILSNDAGRVMVFKAQ